MVASLGTSAEKVELLADDLEADDLDASMPDDSSSSGDRRTLATVASLVLLRGQRRKVAASVILCAAGAAVIALSGSSAKSPSMDKSVLLSRVATMLEETSASSGHDSQGSCHDAKEGDGCYFSVNWAMTHGVYEHPEWYAPLSSGSSFGEFQLSLYSQKTKTNCTGMRPCGSHRLEQKAKEAATDVAVTEAPEAKDAQGSSGSGSAEKAPPPGPRAQTFYMYRSQSEASYPLENINTADLAGAFWYLHNEVIVATPRKYKIDRIKRYKVTVKNTWEFWNAHKRQFGAFVAYDAGRCSTPVCKDIYKQYGFIVGCQVQPLSVAGYLGRHQTNWQCKEGQDECRAPIWYALPGPCPAKGIPNSAIDPNRVGLDVNKYKSAECVERMPGGHCKAGDANGSPDCTYSYEEAGEIFLDELVGLTEKYTDYNEFWNTSFTHCMRDVAQHKLPEDTVCRHNKEYDPASDEGVGTSFWNGKHDTEKCAARMDAARKLFKQKFPAFPEHLDEPACEFDMYYDGEFNWKINHTGAETSQWWENRM